MRIALAQISMSEDINENLQKSSRYSIRLLERLELLVCDIDLTESGK